MDLKHWKAALPFPLKMPSHSTTPAIGVSDTHPCEDILKYVKPLYEGYKIYFSEKYSDNMCTDGGNWKDLMTDLALAGMQDGFYLIGNGSQNQNHIVTCRGSRLYQGCKRQQRVQVSSITGLKPSTPIAKILKGLSENYFPGRPGQLVQLTRIMFVHSLSSLGKMILVTIF